MLCLIVHDLRLHIYIELTSHIVNVIRFEIHSKHFLTSNTSVHPATNWAPLIQQFNENSLINNFKENFRSKLPRICCHITSFLKIVFSNILISPQFKYFLFKNTVKKHYLHFFSSTPFVYALLMAVVPVACHKMMTNQFYCSIQCYIFLQYVHNLPVNAEINEFSHGLIILVISLMYIYINKAYKVITVINCVEKPNVKLSFANTDTSHWRNCHVLFYTTPPFLSILNHLKSYP